MPDLAALKSAARAAIVIPAVFALADKVIEQPQTSLIAAFGSFALLVLVDFAGPPRTRLVAYVALACVGAAFITLGTPRGAAALLRGDLSTAYARSADYVVATARQLI